MPAPASSTSQRSTATVLFERFLLALCDPHAGERLLELHAPEALVRHVDALRPASECAAEEFARGHHEVSIAGRAALPNYASARLLQAQTDPDTLETVAWFELRDRTCELTLIAALGLSIPVEAEAAAIGQLPCIGWCTLAARIEPWTFRDGLLQSLADYPWMRPAGQPAARALLDASYFRRHWRPAVKFMTLPDARFSCQMSTACCKHDFEITLPPEAQRVIDAMPWERLRPELAGTRLAVRADGKLQLKEINEACRFLGTHRQCLIHQTLGRQPFGPCAVFPFSFAQTPEGIAVSLSPICGSTRLGLGVAPLEREDDLRERLAHREPRTATAFRIAPGIEVPWKTFRDVEQGLRECLAPGDIPLRRRLHVGSRLLSAVRKREPIETARWLDEPLAQISSELRAAIHGMLTKVLHWDRAALRTLPADIPANLCELEMREAAILVRILQNVMFSKVYSYPYDLTTAHNFVIVLYLLALIMQARSAGPMPELLWQELGSLGVHGLLNNVLHEGVPEGFRALLGTSDFGRWALAA
ncbi:MAG TPA: hypothetical protein VIY54_01690 [Steroidobacteraceae bacterium]